MFSILTHNGRITIKHAGKHRTFRVMTQADDDKFAPGKRIVSLLTGKNNQEDYTGFGFVEGDTIRLWRKYADSKDFRAYISLLLHPQKYQTKGYEYLIEGCCRRCNRPLTTPQSIQSGIGPVCMRIQASENAKKKR